MGFPSLISCFILLQNWYYHFFSEHLIMRCVISASPHQTVNLRGQGLCLLLTCYIHNIPQQSLIRKSINDGWWKWHLKRSSVLNDKQRGQSHLNDMGRKSISKIVLAGVDNSAHVPHFYFPHISSNLIVSVHWELTVLWKPVSQVLGPGAWMVGSSWSAVCFTCSHNSGLMKKHLSSSAVFQVLLMLMLSSARL